MKALLILGLALLMAVAVWFFGRHEAPSGSVFAERLYQAQFLTDSGRVELLRQMRLNLLKYERTDPLTHNSQEVSGTNRASILNFCAEAFQTELGYRMPDFGDDDLFIAGQADNQAPRLTAARMKMKQELKRFGGDTSAWLRHRQEQLPTRMRIEEAIPVEDSLPKGGWTIYPPIGGPMAAQGLHHWISERRSVWGKTRTRTAHDLLAVGLLDTAAYQRLQKALQSSRHLTEGQVCQLAAHLMQQRETYAADQAAQSHWLQQLEQAGLLSPAQRQRIGRETTRSHKVKSLFEVVAYCKRGRIVALQPLSHQPQELYSALFAEVQALLPGFHYTNLHTTLSLKDEGLSLLAQNVTLSFEADGRRYTNTFLQDYRRKDGTIPNPQEWSGVSEDFHKSINQWLADQHSPLRLCQAWTPDAQSPHGNERLGLLAMTQAQRQLWGPDYTYSILSSESYDTRFSSAGIEQLITAYQQLGLLSHLSNAEIAQGRREALAGTKSSCAEVLLSFPHVIHAFDWESANPPYPYAALTWELAAISHGGFAPTQVLDGFGPDYPATPTVPFGFQLNHRSYRTQLKVQSDWLASESVELMMQALREQHASGQFYSCLDGEGYIFLTPPQHAALSHSQPELFETPVEKTDEPLPF